MYFVFFDVVDCGFCKICGMLFIFVYCDYVFIGLVIGVFDQFD